MGVAWFLVVVVALMALPTAAAQFPPPSISVKAGTFEGRLMPERETALVPITVDVGCNGQEAPNSWTRVTFKITPAEPYITAFVDPPSETKTNSPSQCASSAPTPQRFIGFLTVGVTRDAPAFKDEELKVQVEVEKGGPSGTSKYPGGEGVVSIKTDYFPLISVTATTSFVRANAGSKVAYPLDVINSGNGATRVGFEEEFNVVRRVADVVIPAPVLLESRAQKGSSAIFKASAVVNAVAPDRNGMYYFGIEATGRFDGNANDTDFDRTSLALSLQVVGGAGLAEAPGPFFLVGLLAVGLATAYGRRKSSR